MSTTYIPDYFLFLFIPLSFIFYLYIVISCIIMPMVRKDMISFGKLGIHNKIAFIASMLYSTVLFISMFIHMGMSGFYHDSNGTGPLDAELNFNLITIVMAFVPLLFALLIINKNQENR